MGEAEAEKPRPGPAHDPAPRDDVVVPAARCPFCHDAVRADAPGWVACAACLARHHEGCWVEGTRCAACGHAARLGAVPAPGRLRAALLLVAAGLALALVAIGLVVARAARHEVSRPPETPPTAVDALPRPGATPERLAHCSEALAALTAAAPSSDPLETARRGAAKQAISEVIDPEKGTVTDFVVTGYWMALDPDDPAIEERLRSAERWAADHPQDASPDSLANLGHLRTIRGDGAAGLELANRGLDLDGTSYMCWLVRGQAHLKLGDLAAAQLDLLVSDALCPGEPGWVLVARADLAEANAQPGLALYFASLAQRSGTIRDAHNREVLVARIARLEAATR